MGQEQSSNGAAPAYNETVEQFSGFTPDQVNQLKARFEKYSGSFGVDRKKFAQIFAMDQITANRVFDLFDNDGNGKVDCYEFICGIAMICQGSVTDKIKILFNMYDFDKSNSISQDEMTILLRTALSSLAKMSDSKEPTDREIEIQTEQAFAKADTNHDGTISFEEFEKWVRKNPQIQSVLNVFQIVEMGDRRPDLGVEEPDTDIEREVDDKRYKRTAKQEKAKEDLPFLEEQDGEGDEFLAVKPWLGAIKQPSNWTKPRNASTAPDANLKLEYVYGYHCYENRNNLHYLRNNQIVYHVAATGIVLDPRTNTQKFFIEHNDDIIALAIHPNQQIVATAEVGRKPLICVWDTSNMKCLATMQGDLSKGVNQLAFSRDGSKLAACATDNDHTIAIYDWANKKGPQLYCGGRGGQEKMLSMAWSADDTTLVVTGVKVVNFFEVGRGALKAKKGTGYMKVQGASAQAILSVAFTPDSTVTGTISGHLYKWSGPALTQVISAHEGAVYALYTLQDGRIVSGGKDGKVKIWSTALTVTKTVDIRSLLPTVVDPCVRAVCMNGDNLLIGTRGGQIITVDARNAATVVQEGHFDGELWGVATNPAKPAQFVTVGDDKMLRIWDSKTRKSIAMTRLDAAARAVDYSPDGTLLAVAFQTGAVNILNSQTLQPVPNGIKKEPREWIQDVKFSPDGSLLAVGSHDNFIYIYDCNAKFKMIRKLTGHSSYITHLDWAPNNKNLQTNCGAYELLFWDATTGAQLKGGATALKDTKWSTWTCVLGWPVQGIWPPAADGTDINAVCTAKRSKVLATADDFGKVKIFRYPCIEKGAQFKLYKGHSSHVTGCRFTSDDKYLLTTGGLDKGVFQWKFEADDSSVGEEEEVPDAEPADAPMPRSRIGEDEDRTFEMEEDGEGDEFLAVKPWLGQMQASTPGDWKKPAKQDSPPDANLDLVFVHGYRCADARNNLKYTASGDIVYTTAALGIVMNPQTRKQKYFNSHTDDVVCLSIHPSGNFIATGQMGKNPAVHVWDTATCTVKATLQGFQQRAVRTVAFSPSGDKVACTGEDNDHCLAVYDWQKSRLLGSQKCDKANVFALSWKNDSELVTCGAKQIAFWSVEGRNFSSTKGLFGSIPAAALYCIAFNAGGDTITGAHTGDIYIWSGRNCTKAIKAHTKGPCLSIIALKSGSGFLSGGQDGLIYQWDPTLKTKSRTIDMKTLGSHLGSVRSLDQNATTGNILVGTRSGEIIEVPGVEGAAAAPARGASRGSARAAGGAAGVIINGHYDGELWGLATSPSGTEVVTAGEDNTVRVFDLNTNTQTKFVGNLPEKVRSADWSPNGQYIALGLNNGQFMIVDAATLGNVLVQGKTTLKGMVQEIKFSPDGTLLAIGSHDGASPIQVYTISNPPATAKTKKKCELRGSTSAITHFDWSADSTKLVSNSQAYELFFWDVGSGRQIAASAAKNIQWASWTCVLGWTVQGIWPPCADGTDINGCARSNNQKYIATADDFGKIKLFRYPCVTKGAGDITKTGHSSHVTSCRFTPDDQFLVSTGGNDKSVFIWKTDFGSGGARTGGRGGAAAAQYEEEEQEENKDEDDEDYQEPAKGNVNPRAAKAKQQLAKQKPEVFDDEDVPAFEEEEIQEGDEFLAVKPWLGAIKEPTNWKKPRNQDKAPYPKLVLDWVHGYRSHDTKNNLRYTSSGEIAYIAAALGIVYQPGAERSQRYFNKHTDDVIAFDIDSTGQYCATGEMGKKPAIHVWDTRTMNGVAKLVGSLQRAVLAVAFNPAGDKVAGVGQDADHSVAVYDWRSSTLIACVKSDKNRVLELAWKSDTEFVTAGIKHIKFWTVNGRSVTGKQGTYGKNNRDQRLGCVAICGGDAVTGVATGDVYKWAGTTVSNVVKVSTKPVDALWSDGTKIITGARDGKVIIWNNDLSQKIATVDMTQFDSVCPAVRSVCLAPAPPAARGRAPSDKLLVGTLGGEIFEVTLGQTPTAVKHMSGHYAPDTKWTNEVWGLAIHPTEPLVATCSMDKTVRLFSLADHEQVAILTLETKLRSLSYSPDGTQIAVGNYEGGFTILDGHTLEVVTTKKDREREISIVKYSPDGSMLAVGSHDTVVDIYLTSNWKRKGICKGHHDSITHIDWLADGSALQTNSAGYELLFWDPSGKQLTGGATALRDKQWATWTCVLGWPVQGIWPAFADGTDINACDRTNNKVEDGYQMLATADDFGAVKLFRYPCVTPNAEFQIGTGHSSHVTNCAFTPDDQTLVSTGGNDLCVFVWKVDATPK
eukprot:GILJ01006777.1.p1 GENE.GILJ01006777.1~~GILJ01006777.1.p1  ORF type:complete len:2262 (-),score=409.36 GILJ01006777.1:195-6980(-)